MFVSFLYKECSIIGYNFDVNLSIDPYTSTLHFAQLYTAFDSEIAFAILLGPTDPCSIAVSMEPFSTLALKGLTWVFATTTKICTIGGSRQDHSLIPFNATNTTLLHVETY